MNKDHIHREFDAIIIKRVAAALGVPFDSAYNYIKAYRKPVWYIVYRLNVSADLRAPFARIEV